MRVFVLFKSTSDSKFRIVDAKDMVGYVSVGLEMYDYFLNFNVLHLRSTVPFNPFIFVSGVNKKL